MKKIKIFKSGFCEKLKLLLIPIGLLIGSLTTQVWAERWVSKCNIKYYTHNGYEQTHDGWHNNDGFDIATANVTYNFGTLTQFYFKESWAKGSFDNNWGTAGCKMVYGFSADNQTDYKRDWGDQTGDNPKHYDFPIDEYDVIDHAPNKPGENTLFIYYHLNYNRGDGGDRKSKTLYINFTIPGFSGAPASKSFGTSIPVNTESETTISFTHYGNALEVGDCSLSNATDFEIRSISESGVNVIFKPITTGAKSSTLTITDDHGKTCTITLSGTAVAKGTTTRLYFNDYQYSGAGDWAAASALYRFTCAYTSGVYTHYNMTKCDNTEHTYYADVEIKGVNVSIDRYNHSSPYETYNSATPTSPNLSSTNPYAKSTAINGAYATNHPVNDVGNRKIYYDNLESGFTNTICMLLGRDKQISNDASSTYSKAYTLSPIENTKLSYYSVTSGSDNWHDATYYAFIGTDVNAATISGWSSSNNWGSSTRSTKANGCGYTAAYTSLYGLIDGSTYLASAPSKTDGAMTITKSPTLNTTQTFNYALSTDGGSTYPALTSGVNTPGKLSMSSYEFTNAGCTAVVAKSAQELAANATTYTKAVSNVAYTGTTELEESNTREGYTFMGWYEGNTQLTNASTHSYTYYPRTNQTLTARYKAHRYTIEFNNNDAQYSSAPVATGSTASISNVVYDQNATLTANGFEREGYTFAGWSTTPAGDVVYTNGRSVSNLTATDGATVTLYAQWNEILHDITVEYKYGETSVQDDGEVEDVGIVTTKDATAPATIGGYSFTTWSAMPSDVQTSSSLSGCTITINATDDGQTITANYEPSTYVGDIDGVDGGDGAYSIVYHGTSLTATTVPTRTGYDIGGYYLNYNAELKEKYYNPIATANGSLLESISTYTDEDGKWIKTSAPATIYASWENKTYTITLDKNTPAGTEGTAGDANFTAKYNTNTFSTISNYPTAVGYTFAGYYDDPDDEDVLVIKDAAHSYAKNTGTIYIDGSGNWISSDEDLTLYAHWTANPYTITLNEEGATTSGSTSISVTFDASTNLTGTPAITVPEKTGYTFGGYYTAVAGGGVQIIDASGNVIAQAGGDNTYTNSSKQWKYANNLDLYAKWTQTINFNQNSATVAGTTSLAATYHTTLSTAGIENPKRIGYAFAGWATAADGSVVIGTDGTVNSVDGWTDGSKNWVHGGTSTLVAKWDEDVKTFTGGEGSGAESLYWSVDENWKNGDKPTNDYSKVLIKRGAFIREDESYHVGEIVIESGSLTIEYGGALEVAGTITRSGGVATETSDISLVSAGSAKQSALILDNSAGTTKASVSMWTTAKYNPSTSGYSFQYVAVPMTMVNVSDAFSGQNVYTYVWNEGSGWERRNYYYSLFGFEAVGVTSKDGMVAHTTGTLVSTANIVNRPLAYTSGDGVGMNMIGNSWTAPIKISEMEITGNAESTVYVYNSSTGSWVGNPTAVSGDAIVPAMQAYLIKATSGGGSLSIDYDKAVRGVAASDRTAPLFAPKRDASSAGISEIRMRVSDDEDFYSVLRLFENEQFTDEFDNGWEARYIAGEGFAGQLYAQTDDKMTVLATPDLEGIVVGFIPGVASSYTVSFEGDGKGYYLNDVEAKKSTLIEEGNTYTFAQGENNAARFIISRTPIQNLPTGVGDVNDGAQARKVLIDNKIYIIRGGRMYDATGALVK